MNGWENVELPEEGESLPMAAEPPAQSQPAWIRLWRSSWRGLEEVESADQETESASRCRLNLQRKRIKQLGLWRKV